jgi:colanic acid/amylovoran biosynthesis glycosyltransferase
VQTNSNPNLPGVLIYAPHLLPAGQHYVREHALRLQRYRPALAGRRRVAGTSIADLPNFTLGLASTGFREFHFLLTGNDRELSSFVRRHKIKLIHAHFGPGGVEIMPLASHLRIPLVVTFHGWDVKLGNENARTSAYERLYRWRLPRLFQQTSAVVCVSHAWRDRLITLGCPPEKVHTNYLGVDSNFFDGVRGEFDPSAIVYVGRLIFRKGVHTLLEALRELRRRQIPAHLTVVGDGPERPRLQQFVIDHNLPVRFLGPKTLHEIRELLRGAAVLCAPSTTVGDVSPEALGLVLLEAQAMSVPVVATRNGGMPETLLHGRTGFVVDPGSGTALANPLATLLSDPALNRSFGQNARAFVCDHFDIARCYHALEDLYDSLPINP